MLWGAQSGQPCPASPLQLFKGKFYHCLGADTRNITNRSDCVAANYRWVHHKYNFDNLGQVRLLVAGSRGVARDPTQSHRIRGVLAPGRVDVQSVCASWTCPTLSLTVPMTLWASVSPL